MSNAEFIKPYTKIMRKGKSKVEKQSHEKDKNTAALIGIIARQNAEIARLLQENEKLKILLSDAQTCVEQMLDAIVLKKEPKP